ncbi:MAG: hydantoinase/oxoprolinase N-terminal domain-containing protein, partial [Pararhodobacter sp.]
MAQENTSLAVAVDIGGTFTDVALVDHATGRSWRAKTPSIPADPSLAFLNGITLALEQAGAGPADLEQVLHGTTVATNMILEGKGARAALVTTKGFRHVLPIGRQDIPRKANLYTWVKPVPPVPASRIVEVDERIAAGGAVIDPLDEASVRAAAAKIARMDVKAVAVCLIHAYANATHERRVAEILREELPDMAITVSSDVLPVVREYERSLTTVLNATVMPGVTSYVARLEQRLQDAGATPPLMLMQSNGGIAGAPRIRLAPALTALSGPAAGVVGARAEAEACGISDIITVDIGGTSADICLIKDGKIGLTQNGTVGAWP